MNKDTGRGRLNDAMAAEIRAERAAKGLTVVELGQAIGVSKSKMLALLKGSIDIDVPDIESLTLAFGITPAELMGRAQERVKREA